MSENDSDRTKRLPGWEREQASDDLLSAEVRARLAREFLESLLAFLRRVRQRR